MTDSQSALPPSVEEWTNLIVAHDIDLVGRMAEAIIESAEKADPGGRLQPLYRKLKSIGAET